MGYQRHLAKMVSLQSFFKRGLWFNSRQMRQIYPVIFLGVVYPSIGSYNKEQKARLMTNVYQFLSFDHLCLFFSVLMIQLYTLLIIDHSVKFSGKRQLNKTRASHVTTVPGQFRLFTFFFSTSSSLFSPFEVLKHLRFNNCHGTFCHKVGCCKRVCESESNHGTNFKNLEMANGKESPLSYKLRLLNTNI